MKRRFSAWLLVGIVGLGVVPASTVMLGCVGGSKSISAEDKEKLKAYVLDAEPPNIQHKVDINFENKVHIVGYKIDPETARPGQEVKLTYYWRCDDTIDEGWKLFTHIQDDAGQSSNLDNNGPIRDLRGDKQVLGPDKWEKGKYYIDEQTYKVPDNVKGDPQIYVGIFKGGARLRIIQGPNDSDNRALIGKVHTGTTVQDHTENKAGPPAITVNKLASNQKITIDGKGDDPAWQGATSTGPFVDVGTGKPNTSFPINATAKLAWDDQNLYVLFEVSDPNVTGGFTSKDKSPDDFTAAGQPKLWTKHTVEIMTDPDGDGDNKDYYELQINPQNLVFHSQFDTKQQPNGGPNGPFGHEDWDPKLKSAVTIKGTMDKPDDKDDGYTVEIAIPWTAYSKAAHHPPTPGDTWRMNFYAMQDNNGVGWAPIRETHSFHSANLFGRVTWAVPGAPAADAGAGAVDAGKSAAKDAGPVKKVAPGAQVPGKGT